MSNDFFSFKRFQINQPRSAMRVGTDGVLLGAWFDVGTPSAQILDVGCGTGLIALMAAQRNPSAQIDAVEIDTESCLDAADNFKASHWEKRLKLFRCDFLEFVQSAEKRYDRIVANPPYYTDALKCPDPGRRRARHTDTLSHQGLLHGAAHLLTDEGLLSVILPAEQQKIFTLSAQVHALAPVRTLTVISRNGAPPSRVLMEFGRHSTKHVASTLNIHIPPDGNYSSEYIALTGDFYLKM